MRPYDRSRPFPILTALACASCVVIFLAVNVAGKNPDAALDKWGIGGEGLYSGHYWSLIATAFVHVQPLHLLFNMLWLWTLGSVFEQRFGIVAWLAFVLGSAFVSSGLELYVGDLGIGMSGVGYALFGFGWLTRNRIPEYARVVNDQTVMMFVGWGILCIITTQLGMMHIANLAHGAGFVFGAGIGMIYSSREGRALPAFALVALTAGSMVPLFYNPRSLDWVAMQAEKAEAKRDYPRALQHYKHALELNNVNPAWAWYHIALTYARMNRVEDFERALAELSEQTRVLQGN